MFDFSGAEIMLIGVVSMIFIGPKDFPKVVRWGADALKKCRAMAREFHSQVDEMVKDTDLKEAKDQLMQLRHMNVKSVILDAIDKDGTLQETLNSPLQSSLGQTALSPVSSPVTNPVSSAIPSRGLTGTKEDYAASLQQGTLSVDSVSSLEGWTLEQPDREPDWETLNRDDPAPNFLPPAIAKRLQVKRAAPPVPAMIPPQIAASKDERW